MATEEIGARLSLKDRRKFSSEAEAASESVEDIGEEIDRVDRKAKGLGSTLGGLGSGLAKVGGLAIKAGAIMGGAAAAGIGAFAAMGVQAYAAAEQSQISFTTMLGSGKEAKAFLQDLEDFAATTPFEMQGLTNASQGLLAFGFEAKEVLPMMTAIGDAAAGLGAGEEGMSRMVRAMGQMQAKGKATSEDLMQLAELGVPVWDMLAKKLGTDIPTAMEKVSKGEVKAGVAIEGLLGGMSEQFGGLMEKQSQSVGGLWSTLQDNIRITSKRAIEPFQKDIKNALKTGVDWAERLGAWFKDELPGHIRTFRAEIPGLFAAFKAGDAGGMGDALGAMFGNADIAGPATEIISIIQDLWTVLSDLLIPVFVNLSGVIPVFLSPLKIARAALGWVADNAEALQPILVGLLAGFLAFRAVSTLMTVVKVFKAWRAATVGMTIAQWAMNTALFANPIGLVIAAIVALVAIFVYAWKNSETFRRIVTGVWEKIKAGAGAMKDWVVEKFTQLVGWFKSVPGKISSAASGMWDGIKDAFRGVINWVIDAWNSVDFEINVSIPEWIPKIGGMGWQSGDIVPDIPRLHTGGRTTTGGSAIIQPDEEMVFLPPAASVIPTPTGRVAEEVFGGGGGRQIRVPVYLNSRQIAEAVYDETRDKVARQ